MALTITYNRADGPAEFQTNNFTGGDQLAPDVLGLSNGGFVAAYNNFFVNADSIRLNFYDANSSVLGTAAQIPYDLPPGTDANGQPSLTQLANGNVLVVWDDSVAGHAGLRGHLFSPTGALIGSELNLSSSNDAAFDDPQVVALAGGGFVINFTYSGDVNVYYGRYDNAGVEQGAFHQVSTLTDIHSDIDTAVTTLADGGFVVTYTHAAHFENHVIRAAIYNANGSVRTADFGIDRFPGDQDTAKVMGLPNGDFAVVYMDLGWANESGSSGISLQILSPAGTNLTPGTIIHVNTPSTTVRESDPDVTVLPNGFIVVTWTRPFSATDDDIFARVFDQNGNAIAFNGDSTEFVVAEKTTDETLSSVSHLVGGKFITAWQDSHSDGSGGQITSTVTEITRTVVGDAANDLFGGDALRDSIDGGGGKDVLAGGLVHDTFLFNEKLDSTKSKATCDVIIDFHSLRDHPHDLANTDRIDLRGLETSIGHALRFTKHDGLAKHDKFKIDFDAKHHLVEIDTNGHKGIDFEISLHAVHHMSAGDFIL